ncbi:MAG: HD domain-containing protein [Lachnospiraceae bacterium]
MNQQQKEMLSYVTDFFHSHTHTTSGNYAFRNKLDHTVRVTRWVERICAGEHVDPEIPVTAAIFHDIGYNINRNDHPKHSAVLARKYLESHGFSPDYVDEVCEIIALHGNKELLVPSSPIGLIILIEADNIDEKGALCVLRDGMSEGNKPREEQSYMNTYERLKFFAIKDTNNIMVTKTGDKIWKEHIRVLNEFVKSLEYDLGVGEA